MRGAVSAGMVAAIRHLGLQVSAPPPIPPHIRLSSPPRPSPNPWRTHGRAPPPPPRVQDAFDSVYGSSAGALVGCAGLPSPSGRPASRHRRGTAGRYRPIALRAPIAASFSLGGAGQARPMQITHPPTLLMLAA